MPRPGLISDYLTELSAQLPGPVVEELADGLNDTCEHYLSNGLDPDAAATAALTEFGDPQVIIAAFTRLSPPQRAARRLLLTGPVVGACWGAALIISRVWTWHVPNVARLLLGITLLSVIGLLAAAAFGRQYRAVGRVGIAGCIGIAAIDTAMIITVAFVIPVLIWPVIPALAASALRLTYTTRTLRPIMTARQLKP
jgi:hypothetical protein